ncbi:hypothetical protein D3C72_445100 [compost metagenome]
MGAGNLQLVRDVCTTLQFDTTLAWLRPVDRSTVSFTVESGSQAHLYTLNVDTQQCTHVTSIERPQPTANIWKSTEMVLRDEGVFALHRHAPDCYEVIAIAGNRKVTLPIHPAASSSVDTITDFWPDSSGIVYVNQASDTIESSLIVACDWSGQVLWQIGLQDVYDRHVYLWNTALCPLEDGSFLAYINGESYPESEPSELVVGLIWFTRQGEVLDAYFNPWFDLSPDFNGHVEGGGGFLLAGRPILVVDLSDGTIIRDKEGHMLLELPGTAENSCVPMTGVIAVGDRVIVGRGAGGLSVFEFTGPSGLEPALPEGLSKTGLEPALASITVEPPFPLSDVVRWHLLASALDSMYFAGYSFEDAIEASLYYAIEEEGGIDINAPHEPVRNYLDPETGVLTSPSVLEHLVAAFMALLQRREIFFEAVSRSKCSTFSKNSTFFNNIEDFRDALVRDITASGYFSREYPPDRQ